MMITTLLAVSTGNVIADAFLILVLVGAMALITFVCIKHWAPPEPWGKIGGILLTLVVLLFVFNFILSFGDKQFLP